MQTKTIAVINSTGRQAASLIRVASAVGHRVRAQLLKREGLVAEELEDLPNVTILEGSLEDKELVNRLFKGVQLAFINTTSWGDEVAIGKALANAAKKAGVQHYIYSSMPDHAAFGRGWPGLPLWSCKFTVENYIRQIGLPATFVYAGIYNNNFTSLPYPLFCMELKSNGGFEWKAPFHPDLPLPWLDAEHDVGPAVLQIFKDGPRKWSGHRYVHDQSPSWSCVALTDVSLESLLRSKSLLLARSAQHFLVVLVARCATSAALLKLRSQFLKVTGSSWMA